MGCMHRLTRSEVIWDICLAGCMRCTRFRQLLLHLNNWFMYTASSLE